MLRLRLSSRSLLAAALLLATFTAPFFAACSDTPRGVQGIDFTSEAGAIDAAALDYDAGPDAHGPCQQVADPAGFCEQLNGDASLYIYRIDCTGGNQPAFVTCDTSDGGIQPGGDAATASGVQTFCCTTGLL